MVAPNAILNTGGRAYEVRCHPGTREELIGLIEKFMDAQETGIPKILWLSGPAGSGKTAIMQTIAERRKLQGAPHANFFFFRADSSRNNAAPLVATIMHQIILSYPPMAHTVAAALVSNPLVLKMGIQYQFDMLMHLPLPAAQNASSALRPLSLLIDGLDECDAENKTEKRQILQALDNLLAREGVSFRVVIASRIEPQIAMCFNQLRPQVDSIFLDEKYSPEKDIRLFVTAEFNKIKSTHHLAHTLTENWPSPSDIDDIVLKSSGQFIYPATVMRFISHSPASPALNLQRAQRMVPPAKNSPFSHIDAVYTHILAQVEDWGAVKALLASKLLVAELNIIRPCLEEYKPAYSYEVVASCISELTPIAENRDDRLLFYHASFSDFLQDESRSREFFIDLKAFCADIFPILWQSSDIIKVIFAIWALQRVQQPTPEITSALMNVYPNLSKSKDAHGYNVRSRIRDLVTDMHRLYATHDPQSFTRIIQEWISADKMLTEFIPRHLLPPRVYRARISVTQSTGGSRPRATPDVNDPWSSPNPSSSRSIPPVSDDLASLEAFLATPPTKP